MSDLPILLIFVEANSSENAHGCTVSCGDLTARGKNMCCVRETCKSVMCL